MSLDDIRSERMKKLSQIFDFGMEAYPAKFPRKHSVAEVLKNFSKFSKPNIEAEVAGRIMAKREHGGAMFLDIKDSSGKIQVYFKKDILKESFNKAIEILDVGDFIAVSGRGFKTKRNEKTIEIRSWQILTKALRPLPEKWEGLKDVEERFRRRYLDLLMDEEVMSRFKTRAGIVAFLRDTLTKEGFIEVETPILQPIPGGAEARPFITHHNALNVDFYLRIAPELYLKRLLVGGFERIFEIGRNFRNEGVDRDHNPEFTMLELYWAYQDRDGLMKFTENFLKKLMKKFGQRQLASKKWQVIKYFDAVKNYSDRDFTRISSSDWDSNFKQYVRPNIVEPTFIIDYPESVMALAKLYPNDPKLTMSFQLIIDGTEVVKGFAEMNDPLLQRKQMEEQEKIRGHSEISRLDEDFLEALEYGMPPAAGLGIGIDRLAMLITGVQNIREIVFFPTLRPKQ